MDGSAAIACGVTTLSLTRRFGDPPARGIWSNWKLDPSVGHAAYRVVQESLTNITKHAGSGTHALIELVWEAGALTLTISDDGAGKPDTPLPATPATDSSGSRSESKSPAAASTGGQQTQASASPPASPPRKRAAVDDVPAPHQPLLPAHEAKKSGGPDKPSTRAVRFQGRVLQTLRVAGRHFEACFQRRMARPRKSPSRPY